LDFSGKILELIKVQARGVTYKSGVDMARKPHNVDNLLSRVADTSLRRLLQSYRKAVLINLFYGGVMQTDDTSVQIQVSMNSRGIPQLTRELEDLWQEDKRARQHVIELAVPLPKVAVINVLRPVVRLGAVDVSKDLVVDVADDDGASEG
jgi:hypothetical protein